LFVTDVNSFLLAILTTLPLAANVVVAEISRFLGNADRFKIHSATVFVSDTFSLYLKQIFYAIIVI